MKANEITTATAAKRAGVNVRTVRKWVASGAVKGVKVSGRIMVDAKSLDSRLVKGEIYRYARKSRTVALRTDLFKVAGEISVRARRIEPSLMRDVAALVNSASESGLINWDNGFHYVPEINQVRKWESIPARVEVKEDPFNFDPDGELSGGRNPIKGMNALNGIEAIEIVRFIEDVYKSREGIATVTKPSFMAKMEDEMNKGNGEAASKVVKSNDATEKQLTTIANMWDKKDVNFTGTDLDTATKAVRIVKGGEIGVEVPSKRDASSVIDQLFKAGWKPRENKAVEVKEANAPIEPGFYRDPNGNGEIIRVKLSRSGYPFAGYVDGEAYVRGLIKSVKSEWKLSAEEIRQYGRDTGMCMVCSHELTNPESIEAGIGPVCAGRI